MFPMIHLVSGISESNLILQRSQITSYQDRISTFPDILVIKYSLRLLPHVHSYPADILAMTVNQAQPLNRMSDALRIDAKLPQSCR